MSDEIKFEGLGVAPSALDTIVTLAAESVEGVAAVGAPGLAGIVQKGVAKGSSRAVEVTSAEDDSVAVNLHIHVVYGNRLLDVGRLVQTVVADAIASQVGVAVSAVDVYIDGITFEK